MQRFILTLVRLADRASLFLASIAAVILLLLVCYGSLLIIIIIYGFIENYILKKLQQIILHVRS